MKKVVLHLINSNIFSGLENVACDIIQNTSDEFSHVYVTKTGTILKVLKEKKVPYEIIKKMSVKEIRRVVKKYKADIIHAHDFTASCISALSLTRIPIISHLHHNAPWIKKVCPYSILYLISSIRIKKILTVSNSIKNEYIFSNFIKNKVECIANPISVSKITSNVKESDFEKKYDICCVGRLTEAKNPMRFLTIIKIIKENMPDVKVVWIGDGELKEVFLEEMKKMDIFNNIELTGFQKNPYKYMAKSKIFLLTSLWEGFGLSAFEALSLGLPAIVSNVGGLPEIVDDSCGKVCNTNEEFIATAVENLKNNKIYKANSDGAKIKSLELENSEIYYKKIINIYKKMVEKE